MRESLSGDAERVKRCCETTTVRNEFDLLKAGVFDDEVSAFVDLLTGAALGDSSLVSTKVAESAGGIARSSNS